MGFNKKDISKEIRRTTKIQDSCYICDYPTTETHHIIPVRVLTGIVLRFNEAINNLIIPVVALCPNHHCKLHCMMGDRVGNSDITEYEGKKYKEIIDMAEYMDEETEYTDVYNYAVEKLHDIDI